MNMSWIGDFVYITLLMQRLWTLGHTTQAPTVDKQRWQDLRLRLDFDDFDAWFDRLGRSNLSLIETSGGNGSGAFEQIGTQFARVRMVLDQVMGGRGVAREESIAKALASASVQRYIRRVVPTLSSEDVWPQIVEPTAWQGLARSLMVELPVGDLNRLYQRRNQERMRRLVDMEANELLPGLIRDAVRRRLCEELHCEQGALIRELAKQAGGTKARRTTPDLLADGTKKLRLLDLVRTVTPSLIEALQLAVEKVPHESTYRLGLVAARLALRSDYRAAARDMMVMAPRFATDLAGHNGARVSAALCERVAQIFEAIQFDPITEDGRVDFSPTALEDLKRCKPLLPLTGSLGQSVFSIGELLNHEKQRLERASVPLTIV